MSQRNAKRERDAGGRKAARSAARSAARDDVSRQPAASTGERLRLGGLAAIAGLLVITQFIPCDSSSVQDGTSVLLVMAWLLLLAGVAIAGWWQASRPVRLGWDEAATVAFLALIALGAVANIGDNHARPLLNVTWQWIGFVASFLVVRHVLRGDGEQRALVALLVALAVGLAVFGFYQYGYSMPRDRDLYRQDPDRMLQEIGIVAPPDSPVRKQFEDRLASTEPIATFALTNSLAAYLSTWLVALFGVGLSLWSDGRVNRDATRDVSAADESPRPNGSTLLAGTLAVLLIGGCLVLTKSRTAYLATMMGVGLLAVVHADTWRRRIGWRLPLIGALLVVAVVAGAFLVGGLDRLVLSEAPKSLLYRWEYWQATMAMIADHPWLGVGPGSFQERYTAYKLPQSSETILEPHNFVLEIAAIAGLPALAAFLAVLFVASWRFVRGEASPVSQLQAKLPPAESVSRGSLLAVAVGASVGGLLTSPVQFLVGYVLDPVGVWLALIAAAATWIGLTGWIARGRLSHRTLGIAAVVLLMNLLVSGGIGTPGVAQSLWLLLAVLPVGMLPVGMLPVEGSSVAAETRREPDDRAEQAMAGWPLNRAALAGAALISLVLLVAFIGQVYSPVLRRQAVVSEAAMFAAMGRTSHAEAAFLEAAEIDPASAEPWEQLTAMRLQVWLGEPTFEHQQAFEQAAERMLEHLPHSHRANTMYGNWLLAGYRRSSRAALVDEVLAAWERAVRLYPNSALAHARLAWAAHLAGDGERAASEAAEALRLDALNPHVEQQLVNQTLDDPAASEAAENVELLMQTLRSSKDHSFE